jgi:hypothetical protein
VEAAVEEPEPHGRTKENLVAKVTLAKKMAFGYYKLPVVVDTERYYTSSDAPVMGVWCPQLNDRSSILKCSACPQFGGLMQDSGLCHTFVRCRCGAAESAAPPRTGRDSGAMHKARRLTLTDAWRR